MDEEEIVEALFMDIDDYHAINSEAEGDSDAEDDLTTSVSSNPVTRRNSYSSATSIETETAPLSLQDRISTPSSNKVRDTPETVQSRPGCSKTTVEANTRPKRKAVGPRPQNDDSSSSNCFSDDSDNDPTYDPQDNPKPSFFNRLQRIQATRPTNNRGQSSVEEPNNVLITDRPNLQNDSSSNGPSSDPPNNTVNVTKCVTKKNQNKKVPRYKWCKTSKTPSKFEDSVYSEPFGPIADIDYTKPAEIFKHIFDDDITGIIVRESNLYATQKGTNLGLTKEELHAFLGILIFMGFHELPSMRLYWSDDENFHVERISRVMPLKRFLKILRLLHLNDNSNFVPKRSTNYDKLYKLRPLLDHLSQKYLEVFSASRNLSIDESMAAFKGRSTLKQYMPKKPIKRGFKIWAITCAKSGFLLKFEVYTGKKENDPELGLGENVVNFLIEPFANKNYCLFFDNFFSSINLFDKLFQKDTFACATIRYDRVEFPVDYLKSDKDLKRHEHDFAQCLNPECEDISVVKWKDRGAKAVSVISNMHDPSKAEEVLRTNKTGTRDKVSCPAAIADYNRHMGGVDLFDQHMAVYSIAHKSRRWWVKLFYYFLESVVVNSYILHEQHAKKNKTRHLSHLMFRSTLVNSLINSFTSRKKRGPPSSAGCARKRNKPDGFPTVENTTRLSNVGIHMPTMIKTYRRCAFCSTKEKEKRSNMLCEPCGVALCKQCFGPFHSR